MTATTADSVSGDARARRNVLRLAIAQALAGANSAVIMATGSIVGVTFAPTPALATLPLSTFIIGLAAGLALALAFLAASASPRRLVAA